MLDDLRIDQNHEGHRLARALGEDFGRDAGQIFRSILDDGEASANDKFVALELLKNANIAAGGVLPSCQDTGTAIVMGKKGQLVFTGGGDEEAIARGIFETYQTSNLRYSQLAPLDMYKESNTGSNLPAQIELYATDGDAYKFLFFAKGGGFVSAADMPPCTAGRAGDCPLYSAKAPYVDALEVPMGGLGALAVGPGSSMATGPKSSSR